MEQVRKLPRAIAIVQLILKNISKWSKGVQKTIVALSSGITGNTAKMSTSIVFHSFVAVAEAHVLFDYFLYAVALLTLPVWYEFSALKVPLVLHFLFLSNNYSSSSSLSFFLFPIFL